MRSRTFTAILLLLLAGGCRRQLPDSASVLMPQIQSLTVTDITECGATLIASVTRADLLVRYGFTIEEEGSTVSRNVSATLDGNLITVTLNDLDGACSYSFKAYIDNGSDLRVYSEEKTFQTLTPPPPPENNPEDPDDPENPDNPDDPDPPETGYIEIPDGQFRAWVLWNFDADQDGRLSTQEAKSITTIELGTDDIQSLAGIEHFPSLVKLHAEGTRVEDVGLGSLSSLDLSGNPKLSRLYVPHNRIKELDLSPVPNLVQCELCINELTTLDVSMLKKVGLLNVSYNPLKRLDVRGLDKLDELHCENAPIRELLLENALLRYVDCHATDVETLDFSRCPKLNTVDCLDCPKLTTIYMARGQVLGELRKDGSVKIVYHD